VIGERGDDGAHEADKAIGTSRGGNVHDQHQARTIKPCLNPVDRECPLIRRIVVVHAAHTHRRFRDGPVRRDRRRIVHFDWMQDVQVDRLGALLEMIIVQRVGEAEHLDDARQDNQPPDRISAAENDAEACRRGVWKSFRAIGRADRLAIHCFTCGP